MFAGADQRDPQIIVSQQYFASRVRSAIPGSIFAGQTSGGEMRNERLRKKGKFPCLALPSAAR
jgi:hypothetical protein